VGDGGLGGSVAVLRRGLLCQQICHKSAGTGAVLKLLRIDCSLDSEFPYFLRKSELIVQLLN
jgi:hypothetical protein